eukprot:CAMPEP_0176249904 /NCGR_PEP_ID=MMETSP0121_2-20121125/34211_1 /TAXON_ID=160619 /ORGANISM="Kryptoperidinium foliaceum, Strain CCMP 1326" /LENGTH=319 /DNA_ID=CAMNT_0017589605 /DNA_START=165 /DNA_END=1125 /DNA_ORIENTATION=+
MPLLNDGRPILLFVLLVLILFLAGVPIQAPPIRIARRIRIRRRLDWRSRADLHYPDAVVAHIPKGQARRQARSLGPRKVSDEACRLPTATRAGARDAVGVPRLGHDRGPSEEGEVVAFQVEAHPPLETLPRCERRHRLEVGALDLARRLLHLALSDHGTCVRAECDAAATAALEVDDRQADVVGVRVDFNLHVDADDGLVFERVPDEQVGAQLAAAIGDLVRLLYVGDARALEGLPEHPDLLLEGVVAALPVRQTHGAQRTTSARLVEGSFSVELWPWNPQQPSSNHGPRSIMFMFLAHLQDTSTRDNASGLMNEAMTR